MACAYFGLNSACVSHQRRTQHLSSSIAPAIRFDRVRRNRGDRFLVQSSKNGDLWSFRKGRESDLDTIRKMIWAERMNPLGLDHNRFLVAVGDDGDLLGFAQVEAKPSEEKKEYVEFRTLIVKDQARGDGLGSALAKELLEKYPEDDVYMTTIGSSTDFYERLGFKEVQEKDMPRALWFEWKAGMVVAKLAVNDRCLVMKKPAVNKN
ncbi:hypothetical protein BSKO_03043 [Bryopsis sp. KO-2023]|nr:hypothetical protein BSKO_03043 [Bryopsis sp. KO-2023]